MQLHPELHGHYFERAADLNCEKLGAYKPEEDFKPGFEEKIRFFRFFLIFKKKVIVVWSFDSLLQLNCQQIYRLHEISFNFSDEQIYLPK